ncbi:uncharacterized protein BDZ99DRAFT_574850 [Mytilinidion resinicola]|uniref:C2H2-type domain-containing protein n=1 Tax=Mytilinidion resinicola TaxID=574789 RepID=A0A6A6YAX3_9PEZI|nr:uncharacterized protein BDZ99DRAFT_574850 [Mytilinidion resinicola]KAF2805255.1 hypothetical protein BDZ99DRAFT_574850 [Mytilinidion resinicola]
MARMEYRAGDNSLNVIPEPARTAASGWPDYESTAASYAEPTSSSQPAQGTKFMPDLLKHVENHDETTKLIELIDQRRNAGKNVPPELMEALRKMQATLKQRTQDAEEYDSPSKAAEDAVKCINESIREAQARPGDMKGNPRFYCTDFPPCNLSFTRSEHLARHIQKHTSERPFQCHCGRRFSRLDSLCRHAQTVHVDEDILPSRPASIKPHDNDEDIKDPTPRGSHDSWRFSPSLLDPNSFSFNSFANQPPGYYTPTPGGVGTLYHNQASDLPAKAPMRKQHDEENGVNRCPMCSWELEGGRVRSIARDLPIPVPMHELQSLKSKGTLEVRKKWDQEQWARSRAEEIAREGETPDPQPKATEDSSDLTPRQKAKTTVKGGSSQEKIVKSRPAVAPATKPKNLPPLSASPPVNASDFEVSHPVHKALSAAKHAAKRKAPAGIVTEKSSSEADTVVLGDEGSKIKKKTKKKCTVRDPEGYLFAQEYSDSNESYSDQSSNSPLRSPVPGDRDINWANWDEETRGLLLLVSKPRGLFNKYTISQDMTTGDGARYKCRLLAVDSSTLAKRRNQTSLSLDPK